MNKNKVRIFLTIITIFGVIIMFFMFFNSTIEPNCMAFSAINVSESKITLKGEFVCSSSYFRSYEAYYEEDILYIKFIGSNLKLPGTYDNINISFPNNYRNISKIYIKGTSENKLIWVKN